MTSPEPSYRETPEGYWKWPTNYNTCPLCGTIKAKTGKLCIQCRKEHRRFIEQPDDPTIRYIALTQGKYAIVDASDYEWLMQWNWFARKDKELKRWYAARSLIIDGRPRMIHMHRVILGLDRLDPRTGDHIEPDLTLDNRRSNLRIATTATEQCCNQRKRKDNKSGYKGVHFHKDSGKWETSISVNKKRIQLGLFHTAEEAYAAYCAAATKYHGEFARIA